MPKLSCPCGATINVTFVPCPDGYVMVHEPAWDEIRDEVAELARAGAPSSGPRNPFSELLGGTNRALKEAYVCPTCGRLLVMDRDEGIAAIWVREAGDPQALLRRSEGAKDICSPSCPSCGNDDPEAMVFVRNVRNAHRMRWAREIPNTIEVELDRIAQEKILGQGEIECRRCYVTFEWPEDVGWVSLHPSNWGDETSS